MEARLRSPRANSPSWVAVACLKWELRLSWGVVSFPRKKTNKAPDSCFFLINCAVLVDDALNFSGLHLQF
jgi:hypothetical protein